MSYSAWHADDEPPSPAYSRLVENDTAAAFASPRLTTRQPAVPPVPKLPVEFRSSLQSGLLRPDARTSSVGQADPPEADDTRSVKSWKSTKSWWSVKSKKAKKTKKVSQLPDTDPEKESPVNGSGETLPSRGPGTATPPPMTEGSNHLQAILDLRLDNHCLAAVYNKHESGIMQIYDAAGNEVSYTFGGIDHFKSLYELLDESSTYEEERGVWRKMKGWGKSLQWKLNWSRRKMYFIEIWVLKKRQENDESR